MLRLPQHVLDTLPVQQIPPSLLVSVHFLLPGQHFPVAVIPLPSPVKKSSQAIRRLLAALTPRLLILRVLERPLLQRCRIEAEGRAELPVFLTQPGIELLVLLLQ